MPISVIDKIKSLLPDAEQQSLMTKSAGIGYRLLSVTLSVIFFAVYSKVIFVLFMAEQGFFSYDLMASGTIGIEIFFFTTELMLVFIALLAVGSLILILKAWWRRKATLNDAIAFTGAAVIHAAFWRGLWPTLSQVSEKDFPAWILLLALSLIICFHLSVLLYRPPKSGVRSLLFIIFVLTSLTFVAREQMVDLLKFGLKAFGVGGEIAISVQMNGNEDSPTKKGKLLFLSPEHAYVVFDGENELSIIPRSTVNILRVASRKAASKQTH